MMIDGSFDVTALASEVELAHFREDVRPLGDHSSELDQRVQVDHSQVTKLVLYGQVSDSHEYLRMDLTIGIEQFQCQFVSYYVQNG